MGFVIINGSLRSSAIGFKNVIITLYLIACKYCNFIFHNTSMFTQLRLLPLHVHLTALTHAPFPFLWHYVLSNPGS